MPQQKHRIDDIKIQYQKKEIIKIFILSVLTISSLALTKILMNSAPIKILYIAISDGLSSSNEYLIIKKDDPQIEDVTRASKKFLKLTEFEA